MMTETSEQPAASGPATASAVTLSIVIPAYNEAENIREAVTEVLAGLPVAVTAVEIIIVDDGSRDATAAVSRELAAADDRITLLVHGENRGKGAALQTGFARARMEWVLFMDADLQIHISELDAFLPYTGGFDIIAGFRVGRQDSLARRLFSRVFAGIVSLGLGVRLKDLNCPFKLIRRSLLDGCRFRTTGFAIDVELVQIAQGSGCRIKELPVACHPRQKGSSSVRLRHVLETLKELAAIAGNR
jgi:glycosyltransferase involved in cell wall biosynthesis